MTDQTDKSRAYGVRSETATLRRVVTATPATSGDFAGAGWRIPDVGLLLDQHAAFRGLLSSLGVEVLNTAAEPGLVDFTFVHDSCFVVGEGFVELAMTKPVRSPEPPRLAAYLRDVAGVPQLGTLTGAAHTDGGDIFWLDESTLAVGRGYRTSAAAVDQLRAMLAPEGAGVVAYDLPGWRGPDHVLHLMSVVSLVADDLALTYPPLAPVALLQDLAERGVRTLEVDDADFEAQGCNVLAVRPGVVVMTDATPRTQAMLEAAGVEVHTYAASEINKGDGGPTCLTRPVLRG
jgi:N-dimethylarginine dimethylaminohydrolase